MHTAPVTRADLEALWPVSQQMLMLHAHYDVHARLTAMALGYGMTAWNGRERLYAGGVIRPWDGLGEAWFMISPLGLRHAWKVARHAHAVLVSAWETYALRRIEAKVDRTQPRWCRFAERLGFQWEHDLLDWGPNGETFGLYRWWPEGGHGA